MSELKIVKCESLLVDLTKEEDADYSVANTSAAAVMRGHAALQPLAPARGAQGGRGPYQPVVTVVRGSDGKIILNWQSAPPMAMVVKYHVLCFRAPFTTEAKPGTHWKLLCTLKARKKRRMHCTLKKMRPGKWFCSVRGITISGDKGRLSKPIGTIVWKA